MTDIELNYLSGQYIEHDIKHRFNYDFHEFLTAVKNYGLEIYKTQEVR